MRLIFSGFIALGLAWVVSCQRDQTCPTVTTIAELDTCIFASVTEILLPDSTSTLSLQDINLESYVNLEKVDLGGGLFTGFIEAGVNGLVNLVEL